METYADHDAFARINGKPVVFIETRKMALMQ